ncbi:uncharacterized protein LOC127881653 [Dreissena polymorpha]|nr:uncharacterized protein LOC127881653 [Dreissena polymorpha]
MRSRRMLCRKQCIFLIVVLPLLIVPAVLIIKHSDGHIDEIFIPPKRLPNSQGTYIGPVVQYEHVNLTGVQKIVRPIDAPKARPAKCYDYVWSGNCRDTCYSFNILVRKKQRKQIVLKCEKSKTQLKTVYTPKQKMVHKVDFKDSCLQKVTEWYCRDKLSVPNIVHYVWFGKWEFQFIHFLSFLSAFKVQKPCLIMVHADKLPTGNLWNYFLQICQKVVHVKRKQPKTVMDKKLTFIEHKADVAKLEALKEYGGIYLDTDQVLLKPLEMFRSYDVTIGLDNGGQVANSIILAKKNAAFINLWLEEYRTFTKNDGNKHSQIIPFTLAQKFPHLVKIVGDELSAPNAYKILDLYARNFDWTRQYGMHMHLKLRQKSFGKEKFDMDTVKTMNTTAGAVARYILYGNTDLCTPPKGYIRH